MDMRLEVSCQSCCFSPNPFSNVIARVDEENVCFAVASGFIIASLDYDPTVGQVEPFKYRLSHYFEDTSSVICCLSTVRRHGRFNDTLILCGSKSGKLFVSKFQNGAIEFSDSKQLGNGAVLAIAAFQLLTEKVFIVSSCEDGVVRLSSFDDDLLELSKEISLPKRCMVFTIDTVRLSDTTQLAFTGNDNGFLELFELTSNYDGQIQTKMISLKMSPFDDWIRSVKVFSMPPRSILVAASSQDQSIRIYNLSPAVEEEEESDTSCNRIRLSRNVVTFSDGSSWELQLDSVLNGHDGHVYCVDWAIIDDQPTLISGSVDQTVVVWQRDSFADGLWMEEGRLGEVGGSGAHGFVQCLFLAQQSVLLALDMSRTLQSWLVRSSSDFVPVNLLSGHSNSIEDVSWEPVNGAFLLTTSVDQTTRLFAPVSDGRFWFEIARPQIHGYDLRCIATAMDELLFVSGADEKVLRVFQASRQFIDDFEQYSACANSAGGLRLKEVAAKTTLPSSASVPPLGLSNKADSSEVSRLVNDFGTASTGCSRPTSQHLAEHTLWPEVCKLYGHGYDIFSAAISPNGLIIASACKAQSTKHATIIIWEARATLNDQSDVQPHCYEYTVRQELSCHRLTVTRLRFSPQLGQSTLTNGQCVKLPRFLLSVSRDRSWALHSLCEDNDAYDGSRSLYSTVVLFDLPSGPFKRLLWDCCWLQSTSDSFISFVIVSRCGVVAIWQMPTDLQSATAADLPEPLLIREKMAITCVDSYSCHRHRPVTDETGTSSSCYLIAAGLESGTVNLYHVAIDTKQTDLVYSDGQLHCGAVKRLAFQPRHSCNSEWICVVSAGADGVLKFLYLR